MGWGGFSQPIAATVLNSIWHVIGPATAAATHAVEQNMVCLTVCVAESILSHDGNRMNRSICDSFTLKVL